MNHIKDILLIVAIITLSACASTYQLSETALMQRNEMSRSQAEQILAKMVQPSEKAGGLCVSGTLTLADSDSVSINGSTIIFDANFETDSKHSVQGSVMFGTGKVVRTYKLKRGRFHIDAAALETIRISETGVGHGFPCKGGKPGFIVILMPFEGPDVLVNIVHSDIDAFMAVLSFLSPNARIKKGFGF
jgi:hypothetical protein